MANVSELYNVYVKWAWFSKDIRGKEMLDWNFDKNMENFEEHVNTHLAEGWQLLGPPVFSQSWLTRNGEGIVIQSLFRPKNIAPAVVVEVNPPIVAEQVRPLRSSRRLAVLQEE